MAILKAKNAKRSKLKRLAVVIVSFLVIFSAVSMAASAVVFDVMFARRDLTEDTLELRYSDIDSTKYPRTPVNFTSGDKKLQGYFYGEEPKDGIIVIAHGMGGNAESHLSEAMFFADNGWSVFCFDGTGAGKSEGDSIVGFSQMSIDLGAAVDFVAESYPDVPIFLYGHSAGAYASALVLDEHAEIKGAVLLAGFNRPVETMYYHASVYVGAVAAVEYPFLLLHNRFVFGESANDAAVVSINESKTPVLIVQGSGDVLVDENISIYGRQEEITNPNVSYLYCDVPYRNGHSTLWRSQDAAEYLTDKQEERDALREKYGAPLSGAALTEFTENLERERLHSLDTEFMNYICEFYKNCA